MQICLHICLLTLAQALHNYLTIAIHNQEKELQERGLGAKRGHMQDLKSDINDVLLKPGVWEGGYKLGTCLPVFLPTLGSGSA